MRRNYISIVSEGMLVTRTKTASRNKMGDADKLRV